MTKKNNQYRKGKLGAPGTEKYNNVVEMLHNSSIDAVMEKYSVTRQAVHQFKQRDDVSAILDKLAEAERLETIRTIKASTKYIAMKLLKIASSDIEIETARKACMDLLKMAGIAESENNISINNINSQQNYKLSRTELNDIKTFVSEIEKNGLCDKQ